MRERYRHVIVGSGVAGNAAVTELAARGAGDVLMVSADSELPYDRPPLSKEFLRGVKTAEEIRFHPAPWYGDHGIDLALGTTVDAVDTKNRTLALRGGKRVGYEKLLLAPGLAARRLAVPGAEARNVQYLRSFADAAALKAAIRPGKRVVIVGAGFIGMEVAAACLEKGALVTIVHRGPWLWERFVDRTVASFFADEYARRGATILYEDEPIAFLGEGATHAVTTKQGKTLACDAVVVGVGTALPDAFLKATGLRVENGLLVDEKLQTSDRNVFAAGDVANFIDPVFGTRRRVEHWGHADYTGRLAAQNMLGAGASYGLLTYVFSDLFDLHLEFAGNEAGYDAIDVVGSLADRRFTALYRKAGATRAYFQINGTQEEREALEKEIRAGTRR